MPGVREHFRLEEIAPGVHAAVATSDGWGLCNAAIVDLGESTLVFDAMLSPPAGEALGVAARRLTGRPVDLLVNSHYHGDHIRGNAAVGATHIVSTPRVRELMIERAEGALREERDEVPRDLAALEEGRVPAGRLDRDVLRGWAGALDATPRDWRARPPDVTIESELVVRGSRRSARIVSFGGGHSPSDVLVLLPEDGIVCLGDLVSNGFHPCLWDGNVAELERILKAVLATGMGTAVPGHGPVGGVESIRAMEAYVETLRRSANERAAEGILPDDPRSVEIPAPYADWSFRSFYALNLAFVQRASRPGAARPPTAA